MPGDLIGVEAYNYPLPEGNNLDPRRGRVGIQPSEIDHELGSHRAADPTNKPYAIGDWSGAEAESDEFCRVPGITNIEQNLGAIDFVPPSDAGDGNPYSPPITLRYEWKDVRFYATAQSPGNQMVADLTYTKTIKGSADGGMDSTCTAQFHVVGLWPAVDCTADPPKMGEPPDADGIDETKCSPDSDISKGRPTGSGISPDLLTRCDSVLKLCVLAKEPPSFK